MRNLDILKNVLDYVIARLECDIGRIATDDYSANHIKGA